ncbi:Lysine-specific demethylase REF6 [Raphanus sativus]|nr:Lysine-specific demethylase REF6 [Raphanus sativus]
MSEQSTDVFPWLKSLPVAPEFRPTVAEFQDPIAYIFKIEEEASRYGICKILPPLPPPSKKTTVSNLNRSLAASASARNGACDYDGSPAFATRQQQVGFCPRKQRPVQRPVWQSGERYSFGEFEAKAKTFEKSYLKRCCGGGRKSQQLSALEIETLYWRATVDKPFTVEYANDMPGSAFIPLSLAAARRREYGGSDGGSVGETAWNMRAMARAEGSLLRFMKEEIPGVTSPMVYVAMMFSWFAWHVEDHDLHSLNYLHMGAGKTWYGVPKDAALAFEEVVRDHGYGGELNPLVAFSTLGEKTTVMSPEVFVKAGIPCCRLVQNPGEYVVTFPRAYHSGFSHGFNCGEASNIATPEWLRVAKEAAIRRAAISYPPMVSHLQLLYDYALSLGSRVPTSIHAKPRSSRLKDKKRSEGEKLCKELFAQNIIHNNELLFSLGKGSPVALLPQSSSDVSVCSDLRIGSHLSANQEKPIQPKSEVDLSPGSNTVGLKETVSVKEKFTSLCGGRNINQETVPEAERKENDGAVGLSDQRLFSCVTCGIICFDCVAIVQPKEAAARYLSSADCSFFSDWTVSSGLANPGQDERSLVVEPHSQSMGKRDVGCIYSAPVQSTDHSVLTIDQRTSTASGALGLLASAYGDSSDSEEEEHKGIDGVTSQNGASSHEAPAFGTDGNEEATTDGRTSDHSSERLSCGKGKGVAEGSNGGSASVLEVTLPFVSSSEDDSSRLHVFCLEHAAEVEQQLRPFGGINIMLLCHPEYPRIEAEGKVIAEELGVNHEWNDTEFRNVTREDEETIQAALVNVEAKAGNSDWTVKLSINLSYSAILSRSPLYSKQMPYNSVIYNMFGRSSPSTSSPTQHQDSGKRSSRQRKYVVGKWCGKVWMSHQVHPFLLQEDSEGEETERSHLRVEDVSGERLLPCNVARDAATTMFGRKYSRKRKMRAKAVPRKKLTSFKREDGVSDDTSEDHSYKQQWRRAFGNEEEMSDDSSNPMSDHLKGIRRDKGVREFESDDEVSDRSDSDSSMDRDALEDSVYDGHNDDNIYKHPRSKRAKVIRIPIYQQRGNIQASRIGSDYDSEDDSLEEQEGFSTRKRQTRSTSRRKVKTEIVESPRDTRGRRTLQQSGYRKKIQDLDPYMEGPSTRLRVRILKPSRVSSETKPKRGSSNASFSRGCGKSFFSHKYLVQHRRVHSDDRPLKCPWKGCKMTFKWAWSRTEHIRVHTGERPYHCAEPGCGQTFRFVSDFSRHKKKTGHSAKKTKKR